jgi:hypothetical protein
MASKRDTPKGAPLGRALTVPARTASNSPAAAGAGHGLTLSVGARVLDRRSGEQGTVVSGSAQPIVGAGGIPSTVESYSVALDNGQRTNANVADLAEILPGLNTELIPGLTQEAELNPNPIGGTAAGPNAAAVIAAEQSVGVETLAQQLASGNPGVPEPGSLEYEDWKRRGLLPPGV